MTIPTDPITRRTDFTRAPLNTFGAPVAFTGDLLWLHRVDDENGIARHVHETVVIVFFSSGSGLHEIAGRKMPIAPGDVVIVAPGALHDLTGAWGLSGWALEFSPTVLRRAGHDAVSEWWAHPLLLPYVDDAALPSTGRFNVALAERGRWDVLLHRMDVELTQQKVGWTQAATACLLLLLVEVVRALDSVEVPPLFHADPAVTAALAVVERRYRDGINVAGVAAEVGIAPEHLTTAVRQATGRPLGQWLTDRRMAEARRLLVVSELSIDAVGRRSGYGDSAHFSRRFKQVHGVPPGAWRTRHG